MEKNSQTRSMISWCIATIHFYASIIYGWIIFHEWIFPNFYIAKELVDKPWNQFPLYAINVFAFGTMIYVASRPVVLLVDHFIDLVCRAFEEVRTK